jgi:hypothetical protein
MARGPIKTKFDYKKNTCKYENQSWCDLPKYKKCPDCIISHNVSGKIIKACMVMI